jgi:hypothetical protein
MPPHHRPARDRKWASFKVTTGTPSKHLQDIQLESWEVRMWHTGRNHLEYRMWRQWRRLGITPTGAGFTRWKVLRLRLGDTRSPAHCPAITARCRVGTVVRRRWCRPCRGRGRARYLRCRRRRGECLGRGKVRDRRSGQKMMIEHSGGFGIWRIRAL